MKFRTAPLPHWITLHPATAALVALVVGYGNIAHAQTPEETVAFILNGVEDGRKIVSQGADVSVIAVVKQTSPSPAIFEVSPPGRIDLVRMKVSQSSACNFLVEREYKDGVLRSESYDFNKLIDVRYTAGIGLVNFAGTCAIKAAEGSCSNTAIAATYMGTPPQRVVAAVTYMKANYCSGSGF